MATLGYKHPIINKTIYLVGFNKTQINDLVRVLKFGGWAKDEHFVVSEKKVELEPINLNLQKELPNFDWKEFLERIFKAKIDGNIEFEKIKQVEPKIKAKAEPAKEPVKQVEPLVEEVKKAETDPAINIDEL